MKTVKCKSGLTGWQGRLQEQYEYFDLFESYDQVYNNAQRLGYKSAKEAWDANPIIQGSTNPSDYRVVLDENNCCEFVREDVEVLTKKFLSGKINQIQFLGRLYTLDNKLKKLFGKRGNKSIWFRTFKGDTLATTIDDIKRTLNLPEGHQNHKHLIESLTIGVNEVGMGVYFS